MSAEFWSENTLEKWLQEIPRRRFDNNNMNF
jgi:hypothetical protein